MLFMRPVHREGGGRPSLTAPHPTAVPDRPDSALMVKWILKCFMTGIALSGLAYWLVQIAGAQYLATLTSATLLSFLLVYIVWCLTVKRRGHPQVTDSVVSTEPSPLPTTSDHPLAPPTLNPALKHYGVPPRDCSPPPSYDEVLRQMGAEAAASCSTAYAAPSDYSARVATATSRYDVEAPPMREDSDSFNRIPTSVLHETPTNTPVLVQTPTATVTNITAVELTSNIVPVYSPTGPAHTPSPAVTTAHAQCASLIINQTPGSSTTPSPASDVEPVLESTPSSPESESSSSPCRPAGRAT